MFVSIAVRVDVRVDVSVCVSVPPCTGACVVVSLFCSSVSRTRNICALKRQPLLLLPIARI